MGLTLAFCPFPPNNFQNLYWYHEGEYSEESRLAWYKKKEHSLGFKDYFFLIWICVTFFLLLGQFNWCNQIQPIIFMCLSIYLLAYLQRRKKKCYHNLSASHEIKTTALNFMILTLLPEWRSTERFRDCL